MLIKSGIVLYRRFWRVLTSVLCLVIHILCINALKLLPGFFWLFLGQGLAFFGEDRLANLPAAGMARRRSCHLQPRCWNEHRWFNFSGEFQTALLNWLCKARKEVVVSLPNFLCILIARSLSNFKLKYTTVFKHKRIHNCITHSKLSRNIMAADEGNVPQLRAIITSHTVCTFKMTYCVLHAFATTSILDSFDDC